MPTPKTMQRTMNCERLSLILYRLPNVYCVQPPQNKPIPNRNLDRVSVFLMIRLSRSVPHLQDTTTPSHVASSSIRQTPENKPPQYIDCPLPNKEQHLLELNLSLTTISLKTSRKSNQNKLASLCSKDQMKNIIIHIPEDVINRNSRKAMSR